MTQVRRAIRELLEKLKEELDKHDQTTHGVLPSHCIIGVVAHWISLTYEEPSAYNISTLSQYIDWFLKHEKDQ